MSFQEETVIQEELDDIKRQAKEAALEYEQKKERLLSFNRL